MRVPSIISHERRRRSLVRYYAHLAFIEGVKEMAVSRDTLVFVFAEWGWSSGWDNQQLCGVNLRLK